MRTPRHWQHHGVLSRLLAPWAWLYGIGVRYDRTHTAPRRAPLPVISIGNATAGGAGKTPTAIALVPLLQALGQTPHFITRGYGSSGKGVRRAMPDSAWQDVGDEPLILAQHAPTWVCRDRVAAAIAAHQAGASLVVADDALQHHALAKDISLLVVDGGYGIGNGKLIPAGPLREPLHEAEARCDAVVLIGENRQQLAFSKPVFHATLALADDTGWLQGQRVLAFAGLGIPAKFYQVLQSHGAILAGTVDFPDHHAYRADELEALCTAAAAADAIPVATAKDAVKFPPAYRTRIRVPELVLQFSHPQAVQDWLQSRLA